MLGRRGHRSSSLPVLAGVAAALLLVLGIGPPGLLLPRATTCQLGAEVGTYTIWTPMQMINIPDGGNVTFATDEWNITVASGSLTLNPLEPPQGPIQSGVSGGSGLNRAGIWVQYGDLNWTFYHTSNISLIGASPGPCTQSYVAEIDLPGGGCGGWAVMPLANNASDAVEPHVWNGTAGFNGSETYPGCPQQSTGTYTWFDTSLHTGATGPAQPIDWNLCGVTGNHSLVLNGVAQLPIVLNVEVNGADIAVAGLLRWCDSPALHVYSGPTVTYLVPGGWNWTLGPVGPTPAPIDPDLPLPGLVAFTRSAC